MYTEQFDIMVLNEFDGFKAPTSAAADSSMWMVYTAPLHRAVLKNTLSYTASLSLV